MWLGKCVPSRRRSQNDRVGWRNFKACWRNFETCWRLHLRCNWRPNWTCNKKRWNTQERIAFLCDFLFSKQMTSSSFACSSLCWVLQTIFNVSNRVAFAIERSFFASSQLYMHADIFQLNFTLFFYTRQDVFTCIWYVFFFLSFCLKSWLNKSSLLCCLRTASLQEKNLLIRMQQNFMHSLLLRSLMTQISLEWSYSNQLAFLEKRLWDFCVSYWDEIKHKK